MEEKNDFLCFYEIGTRMLHGGDPYSVSNNYYPPATNFLFALFALIPLNFSIVLWGGLCAILFFFTLSKKMPPARTLVWFGYFPVLFMLFTGQLDLFFFWLTSLLKRKGWVGALAAALLTLKPQIAVVVLPWVMLNWLTTDHKTLLKTILAGLVLHSLPLLYSPHIYQRWLANLKSTGNYYILNSPGLFSLTYFSIPVWILVPFALAAAIYGLTLSHPGSISANLFATPFGLWYNTVLVSGEVPWTWLAPVSWVAFGLAALAQASYPFALIPTAAFLWMVLNRRKVRAAGERLAWPFPSFGFLPPAPRS